MKVLRRQLSELCFIHACVVLQHYLVSINEEDDSKNVGMLDIGKYEGSILTGIALENYLTSPHGGDTISTLNQLCSLGPMDARNFKLSIIDNESTQNQILARNDSCDQMMALLVVQPALVSSFIVMKDFYSTHNVSFTSFKSENWPVVRETHAMVLVGMRKLKTGEYYFLLQNWWRDRYFIEVSYDYLAVCQPEITFVKKKLTQISPTLEFISFESSLETMADKCACNIDTVSGN